MNPLMPKGVEHIRVEDDTRAPGSDEPSDAERR